MLTCLLTTSLGQRYPCLPYLMWRQPKCILGSDQEAFPCTPSLERSLTALNFRLRSFFSARCTSQSEHMSKPNAYGCGS